MNHRTFRQIGQFVSLFCLCLTLVVACQTPPSDLDGPNSAAETLANTRLVVGTSTKPRTIDPADSYEIAGITIIYNVGESLYSYEPGTTELKPLLAKDFPTISDDGITYTIALREGVKFHDGTDFNAAAMAFSLERFMENGGKPSFLLSDTIDTVEATGDYELTITLKKPFAAFTSLLAYPGACAVSPGVYAIGAGEFIPENLVATGPYRLQEYGTDVVRLDVFPDYWGEKPANEGVDIQIYNGNSANLYSSFRTQTVDLASQSFDPDQIASLLTEASQGQFQAIEASGTAISHITLNLNQAPLDQLPVRQAIAHLIDRELIINRVLQGQGSPLYSMIPDVFPNHVPSFEADYGQPDVEAAKTLLRQEGYSAENPAVVELWYPSSSNTREVVASTIKALADEQLEGLLKIEPNSVEGAIFFKNIPDGLYQATLSNWYPDFLDGDNYIQPFLDCVEGSAETGCVSGGAQTQGSFYQSDRMNELIDQERKETDPAARKLIFEEIQRLLVADLPYIPLWQTTDYVFAQNDLTGVAINPNLTLPFWVVQK